MSIRPLTSFFFLFFLFFIVTAAAPAGADSLLLPNSESRASEALSLEASEDPSRPEALRPIDLSLAETALDQALKNSSQNTAFGPSTRPAPTRLPAFLNEATLKPSAPGLTSGYGPMGGFEGQIDLLESSRSSQLLNDRLEIKNHLRIERQTLNAFEAAKSNLPAAGFSSLESELAATIYPWPNLSLGTSFSLKRTQAFGHLEAYGSNQNDWLGLYSNYPADQAMGRVGLGYRNYLGTEFYLSGYAGRVSPAGRGSILAEQLDLAREGAYLRGLGLAVRQDLWGGRLSFLMSAALNRFGLSTWGRQSSGFTSRPNLSAYLAMNYINPELFNAGLSYSFGSDGYFMTDSVFSPGFGGSRLNAKFWRDFSLTPALSLSTRLYGSIVLNRPPEISQIINKPNMLDSYVEGRVTMNYAF
ncbi:MAG: hypothetical protein LBE80_00105 [Deltaproteobacteria bacterium]|jgi:hypothetical protein|nr:hypothetical protein [Deltaproteobacteria bacterium]